MAGNFSVKHWQDRRRNLLEQQAAIAADLKESALEGKVFMVNVSAFDTWMKAEIKDDNTPHGKEAKSIARLIDKTVDQVIYGQSLGYDLGAVQNNQHRKVENISNEADTNRAPDPLPSGVATGGTAELSPAVPPTHSNPVTAVAREASATGQGGVEVSVTAPPEPDIPTFLDRRNRP